MNNNNSTNIEILAPAGGYESVVAAVANGANAIYLGGQGFNARQNAQNFSFEELQQAVDFCHARNVKVYQTLNVLVFDNEIESLKETIISACKLKIDAFIIQDLGVLKLVKEICPQMKLNASTQMTVHSKEGASLLKKLGFSRVVLSRELTLDEIADIIKNVDIEVEVFAHGALCMSVSGQCYMSSMIGGRSGNKGSCAGTCRLPFTCTDQESHDLSLKDLCSTEAFEKLVDIGVTSLKIEGRMKRPEYVAIATNTYTGLKKDIKPNIEELRALFSRNGFTNGYLENKINSDMFGFRLKEDVLSSTKDLLSTWKETYHKPKAFVPLNISFTAIDGEPTSLTISDNENHSTTVYGDVAPIAINKPTTDEMAKEALIKLGGTIYYVENIEVNISEGLIIPKSKLNQMRRDAIENIDAQRIYREELSINDTPIKKCLPRVAKDMNLRARFSKFEQIDVSIVEKLEFFSLPFEEIAKNIDSLLPLKDKLMIEIDRVMFSNEDKIKIALQDLKSHGFDKLLVSNLAHLSIANKLGFTAYGSMFLNITNSYSLSYYQDLGLKDTVLSFENTVSDINKINVLNRLSSDNNMALGAVVYGFLPLMLVRNCPIKAHFNCSECQSSKSLTDRLGNKFRVNCQNKRYSEVLNCKVLKLSDRLREFNFCDYGLLYFTNENSDEVNLVIKDYLSNAKASGDFTRGLYYRGIN